MYKRKQTNKKQVNIFKKQFVCGYGCGTRDRRHLSHEVKLPVGAPSCLWQLGEQF